MVGIDHPEFSDSDDSSILVKDAFQTRKQRVPRGPDSDEFAPVIKGGSGEPTRVGTGAVALSQLQDIEPLASVHDSCMWPGWQCQGGITRPHLQRVLHTHVADYGGRHSRGGSLGGGKDSVFTDDDEEDGLLSKVGGAPHQRAPELMLW